MPLLDRCKVCKTYQPVKDMGKNGVCNICMKTVLDNSAKKVEAQKIEEPKTEPPKNKEKKVITSELITFIKEGEKDKVFKTVEEAAVGMRCKVETVEAVLAATGNPDLIRGFKLKK